MSKLRCRIPKWIGKCAACGEWNTYTEEIIREEKTSKIATILGETAKQTATYYRDRSAKRKRIDTRSPELNRVLGGGLVRFAGTYRR